MKTIMFILFLLLSLTASTNFIYSSNLTVPPTSLSCNETAPVITYVRVFHDGLWWIQVFADGIYQNEYVDDDQGSY